MRDPNDLTPNRRRFLRYLAGSPLLFSSGCWEPRTAGGQETRAPDAGGMEHFGYSQFPRMPVGSPEEAVDVFDFRLVAEQNLPPAHYGYIATGVDGEGTLAANRRALENVGIRARRLVDVSDPDMSVELFGRQWTSPIGIAPCGSQKAFHPEGEVAVARAARTVDHLQLLSTVTTSGVEEVNEARGEGVWYQLYPNARSAMSRVSPTMSPGRACSTVSRWKMRAEGVVSPGSTTPRLPGMWSSGSATPRA
jgi:4-hydroxymandelate oxidase